MPYFQANDAALYYEAIGAGPPLLLLHGLGSSLRDWFAQAKHFSGAYRVIRIDMRGHGRSKKPDGGYSIPQMASDAAALLDHLDLEAAHVVGLSLGGMVTLQMALDHPERVRTATAVNCDVDYRLDSLLDWAIYLTRYLVVRLLGPRVMARLLAPILLPDPEHEDLRKTFIRRYSENDREVLLACINAIAGWSIQERLSEIKRPVLIVASENDYSEVAVKKKYAAKIPGARLVVIPGAHHAVPVEQSERFNAEFEHFLQRHEEAVPAGAG